MKLTESQLRKIIKNNLIQEKNIINQVVDFFKDLGKNKKDEKKIEKADAYIEIFFQRLSGEDLEIAKNNYEKLKKDNKLYSTIFNQHGGVTAGAKSSVDAKVMSYLLVGHPYFKGMSQPQINKKLDQEISKTLKHRVKSEIDSEQLARSKTIDDAVKNSENKEVFKIASSSENLITGGKGYRSSGQYSHQIGETKLLVSYHAYKIENIPKYKFGAIEEKGEGLSAFYSVLNFKIGKQEVEFLHIKNNENRFKNEDAKEKFGAMNGLYINGEKCYGYEGPYSNGFSTPGYFESQVEQLSTRIGAIKSKYPKAAIVSGIVNNYLGQLEFDPDAFKRKPVRQAVLIGSDGKTVVGDDNIDSYLSSRLPKISYKKA